MKFYHQFRHKYHANPTMVDGIRFPSHKEAAFYQELKIRKQTGNIVFFLRQVPFHLPGGVKYVVDFVTFNGDGSIHFIEIKGFETNEWKMKKKLVESLYPIQIEVRK